MSKGSKGKRYKFQGQALGVPKLGIQLGLRETTADWKGPLKRNFALPPDKLGRLVLGSENLVEAMLGASKYSSVATSSGLLVLNYLRGAGYDQLGKGEVERLYRRLKTLDSASMEVPADVNRIFTAPIYSKHGSTPAVLLIAQLDAPTLQPEVDRFNRIIEEIPEKPRKLDQTLGLALVRHSSESDKVMSAINETLPAVITLGPLSVIQLDPTR